MRIAYAVPIIRGIAQLVRALQQCKDRRFESDFPYHSYCPLFIFTKTGKKFLYII